ncbi:transposase, partial [Desulfosarcina sp. OttesenSCG-928-B08]|nr:transposase [Desulfosarcina sp. OttesenSCG-928-B08]
MTAIIYQKDKRIGVTYVYESTSFWDKEKKQSRAKRKLIGKVDPETGQVVPTNGSGRNKKAPQAQAVSRSFCGATELFDAIGDKIGLIDDLKGCFPETWQQILSVAYF